MNGRPHSEIMLRYLAGDLPEQDVAALNRDLKEHESLQREFAELLLQHVLLAEIGKESAALPAAKPQARLVFTWRRWVAAAAVLLVAVVVCWAVFRGRYPSPRVSGPVRIADARGLGRGTSLYTDAVPARLTLGGYCQVEIQPHCTLRIEGQERKEQIFLERGKVVCEVDRGVGAFSVRTELGKVLVTGTRFSVEVIERKGGEEMRAKTTKGALVMVVAVVLGSVDVEFRGRKVTLVAGRTQVFGAETERAQPKSGTVTGVVVAKGRTWINVRADGDEEAKRYIPRWIGGLPKDGGGFDKDMLRGIAEIKVGDRLTFKWLQEEHLRIVEVLKHEPAGHGTIEAGKPEYEPGRGDRWLKRGRIVGRLYRAPVAEIDVINAEGEVIKSVRTQAGAHAYELEWLAPGKYTLRVAARGYKTLELDNLEVKAKYDLVVNIEFSRAREDASGLPNGIKGFRGMMVGKMIEKGERAFVLQVEKITKVWKQNKASNPASIVGRKVRIVIDRRSHLRERFRKAFRELKPGDRVEVEAFHFGGGKLTVVESILKAE